MLKWILPWNPAGWRLVAVLAVVAVVGVAAIFYPSGVSDDARWRAYCASLSGDAAQAARWRGPGELELCDGRRIELKGAAGDEPEKQCPWLARARTVGVPLKARSVRRPYWEISPAEEFASATRNVPFTARLVRTPAAKYGPSDKCELDEKRD